MQKKPVGEQQQVFVQVPTIVLSTYIEQGRWAGSEVQTIQRCALFKASSIWMKKEQAGSSIMDGDDVEKCPDIHIT